MVGLRSGESLDDGVRRVESILDAGFRDWRERETFRRRAFVSEATGALDLPGHTWRNRPKIEQGEQVWLAGDWVRAPAHLVSCTSAVKAAEGAIAAWRAWSPRVQRGTPLKTSGREL